MFSFTSYSFYLLSTFLTPFDFLFGPILPAQRPLGRGQDLTGKNVIVTGANVGIGQEIAFNLALLGATVTLACRNQNKAEAARAELLKRSEGKISANQIEVRVLDLGDLDSVNSFVDVWGERSLDIIVNNGGATLKQFQKNSQGFELSYVTNILSHYLLTLALLPQMRTGGRIINVTSDASYGLSTPFDPTDLDYAETLEKKKKIQLGEDMPGPLGFSLYQRSKLLQIMFTREMQVRLEKSERYKMKGITAHSYHPGLVKSSIWNRKEGLVSESRTILRMVRIFGLSLKEGAATAIYLATGKAYVPRYPGMYWFRMGVRGPNRLVEDAAARAVIWDQMAVETGLSDDLKI